MVAAPVVPEAELVFDIQCYKAFRQRQARVHTKVAELL